MNPRRINFLGAPIDPWTMKQTVAEIERRLDAGTFTQHVVVNVAKVVNIQHDKKLRETIAACDIINADGMGIVWGARFLGLDIPERVAGIDLFLKLLASASDRGAPVFFLGAQPEVTKQAANNLKVRFAELRIAGWHHGYFWGDEESIVEEIRGSGATLLFVGITSPKKEEFIDRYREKLGVKFVMGVGGTFDIMAGKTKRAPMWMQRSGLEWLFRIIQEPGRMWKRYLITNTKYALIMSMVYRCLLAYAVRGHRGNTTAHFWNPFWPALVFPNTSAEEDTFASTRIFQNNCC